MTVLVTGGTGHAGAKLVERLRAADVPVRVASRSAGPGRTVVDYTSGAGLTDALIGADTVVHCVGGTAAADRRALDAVVRAARGSGLRPHLVYLSIVGIDEIPFAYYRGKYAAELSLETSGLPFTIQRATQFHDLVAGLLKVLCWPPFALLPKGIRFQPIDTGVVADRLAELVAAGPAGRVDDIGGPQVLSLPELARQYPVVRKRRRPFFEFPLPGGLSRALRAGANLTPAHALPGPTFADFLAARRHTA